VLTQKDRVPLKVFISCSPEDQLLRKELANHLANLRNQQLISDYYEGDISPGTEWLPQIMDHLKHDQLILLLISSDFMASQFCYSIELKQAIIRHDKDQARVLPILLRPVDYEEAPFAKLQALPSNGVPVTQWPSHDEAFVDVVKGIRKAIDELQASTPPSSIVEELRLVSLDNLSIADLIPMRNQYFTARSPCPCQTMVGTKLQMVARPGQCKPVYYKPGHVRRWLPDRQYP